VRQVDDDVVEKTRLGLVDDLDLHVEGVNEAELSIDFGD
jgi:hypothetical protein